MILLFFSIFSFSMPYPAFDLSIKNQSYESELGFTLNNENKSWIKIMAEPTKPYHLISYKKQGQKKGQGSLNVRLDPVKKRNPKAKVSLKSYTEHWVTQFPKLGLEVLNKEYTTFKDKQAVRIDSYNMNTKVQVRQYVLWQNNNALIFSCSDKKDAFKKSLFECEKILRSLKWTK